MMERTVEVTEGHIEEGLRMREEHKVIVEACCPVQLALKESYNGFSSIYVHRRQTFIRYDDRVRVLYHMPDVWKWLWNFDFSKGVKPIKLRVEKYQGVLRMVIAKEV